MPRLCPWPADAQVKAASSSELVRQATSSDSNDSNDAPRAEHPPKKRGAHARAPRVVEPRAHVTSPTRADRADRACTRAGTRAQAAHVNTRVRRTRDHTRPHVTTRDHT
eukprot:7246697-Prymnesium_polylepis.1